MDALTRIVEKLDVCVRLLERQVALEERRVAADEALSGMLAEMRREIVPEPTFTDWRIDAGRYLVMDGGAWRSATAAESAVIQATHAAPRRR